jgi:site-specific DNA-methyltransferase (adenine-specific)
MLTARKLRARRSIDRMSMVDTIQNMDCLEGMNRLPAASFDCGVTSPPYNNLRSYVGMPQFNLHETGKEFFRVLKHGGVCAMVIQDQTKNFAKTLTTFRTIVDWVDNIGFKLFECVIYRKHGTEGAWWKHRFRVDHEYIPLFVKGEKPAFFDKKPLKVLSKHGGRVMSGFGTRRTDGTVTASIRRAINPTKCRGTVWDYLCAGDKDPIKRQHPATFPDQIPYDIIRCFCPEGGIVLDPFMGSGSTAVAARRLNRRFIGFEIEPRYVAIANQRLKQLEPIAAPKGVTTG